MIRLNPYCVGTHTQVISQKKHKKKVIMKWEWWFFWRKKGTYDWNGAHGGLGKVLVFDMSCGNKSLDFIVIH